MKWEPELDVSVFPVTPDRLDDLKSFSERHGRFRYCSCMRWRMTSSEFGHSTAGERASRLEQMVRQSVPVGVLAYLAGEPIGWCSVAPRSTFAGLERSRTLPRIDDVPVWSVSCFFVDPRFRHRGLSSALLDGAIAYAADQGASMLQAYPVDRGARSYRFMGRSELFSRAGFVDVTPSGRTRTVMRRALPLPAQQAPAADSRERQGD